jgi:hypothetical protein
VVAIARIPRWARIRRWTVGAGLSLVAAVTIVGLLGWALVQEVPVWWRIVRKDDPGTAERALLVENSVCNQIYLSREVTPAADAAEADPGFGPGTEWTVSLKASDANAWLNARLPLWVANKHDDTPWPKELEEVQVDFGEGVIRIGARVHQPGQDRVLSATLEPDLRADGTLWMPASWVSIGRLAVPADWVLQQAEQRKADFVPAELRDLPETVAVFRGFAGLSPIVQNAVIRLEDGRRVRLLKLRPVNGRLEVTCRTERPGGP